MGFEVVTSLQPENVLDEVDHGGELLHQREVDGVAVNVLRHPDPQVVHL